MDKKTIEKELAELRGDRGIPPVILSAPMVLRGVKLGIFPNTYPSLVNNGRVEPTVEVDDDLAARWAIRIQDSLTEAHDLREKDPIRRMAYQLAPERWSRLRPSPKHPSDLAENEKTLVPNDNSSAEHHHHHRRHRARDEDWSTIITRPAGTNFVPRQNEDMAVVFEQLHRMKNIHVSCGAKFGCDYLLYNGGRETCHAFAGLRVLCPRAPQTTDRDDEDGTELFTFPAPSPYDLYGYVRGLNTAGKLALLATVCRTTDRTKKETTSKVLFVDLALEKILSAPTHQRDYKKKRGASFLQKRKDVGRNLEKKKNHSKKL